MNVQSIILLILIAAAFIAAVIYLIKHKGGPCSGCTGDCSQCRYKK
ncbi:MAG: FeoB-associated Cys-rich membrane protein [Lachnospiraceae bacterium]